MSATLPHSPDQVTIGIDISKQHLDAHAHPHKLCQRVPNDPAGIAKLLAWISAQHPTRIIFEATGAYHRGLQQALAKAALPAVKVNPLQARRFAQATGKRAKTDPVDAAMLARFAAALQPAVPPAPDEIIDHLRELLAARRALVKDRTAALNRAKPLTLPLLQQQNRQRLKQIEAQIQAIDHAMDAIQNRHDAFKRRFEILISIPGLGAPTVRAMLIDMPELGSLEPKQAASLSGLAPITRESGTWQGKSRIQGGRAQIRHALYMPALVAIRFNPPLKAKYQALRQAGKPPKLAIVAIMRKLVTLANALLRDQRTWTPRHA